LGHHQFTRYLYFQNGELIRIETGEKGRDWLLLEPCNHLLNLFMPFFMNFSSSGSNSRNTRRNSTACSFPSFKTHRNPSKFCQILSYIFASRFIFI
jgi:hypothetical protein